MARGNFCQSIVVSMMIMLSSVVAADSADSLARGAKAPAKEHWGAIAAEAKKEGKVTIYGQVGPELRVALTEAVKKDLGLDMELVPGKGSEVANRFLTENRAGLPSADIVLGGASTFVSVPELYASWEKLEPLLFLPEVLDAKAWRNGKVPFLDSQKKVIPLVLEVTPTIIVNTTIVKPGQIKSFKDLLQPQWKGKIVMFDPTVGGTTQTWVRFLMTKVFGPTEGEAFLQKLAAQEPVITRDSRLQSEWVARGRYPVCIGLDPQAAYGMHKTGAPITRVAAEEGGLFTGGGGYLVVSLKRPHPNATVAVLNWLLSAAGQEVFSNGYGASAARLGVKTDGISSLSLPITGEKLYPQDEEIVLFKKGDEAGRRVFKPLLK